MATPARYMPAHERRCDCCDGPDGRGIYHLRDTQALREHLAAPVGTYDRNADITLDRCPDSCDGAAFVNASEAEAWLEYYEPIWAAEAAREQYLAVHGGPGRI